MPSAQHNLEYYQSLNYHVIVKKSGSKFLLYISELGLITESAGIEEGYRNLELQKTELFRKLIEIDASDEICLPRWHRGTSKLFCELKIFIVKFVTALLILSIGSGIIVLVAMKKISGMQQKGQILSAAGDMINNVLNKAERLSPESKNGLRMRMRIIAANLKPITDEIHILFPKK